MSIQESRVGRMGCAVTLPSKSNHRNVKIFVQRISLHVVLSSLSHWSIKKKQDLLILWTQFLRWVLWQFFDWPNSLDCTDINQCGVRRDAELCRLCYKDNFLSNIWDALVLETSFSQGALRLEYLLFLLIYRSWNGAFFWLRCEKFADAILPPFATNFLKKILYLEFHRSIFATEEKPFIKVPLNFS